MAYQRKLGRTAAQRKALLRNQVTNLIWYGRIETTLARAKEVRSAAEHLPGRDHELSSARSTGRAGAMVEMACL